jgi:hypothetical protein
MVHKKHCLVIKQIIWNSSILLFLSILSLQAQVDGNSNKLLGKNSTTGVNDYIYYEDTYVKGSMGLGTDVYNGYPFGFNTLVLSENNLRILFEDPSIESVDWQIEINSSEYGGNEYFKFNNVSTGTNPFTIEAGAPNNSVVIKNSKYAVLGIGTDNPQKHLHIYDPTSSALRLERSNVNFPSQIWDMGCNSSYFFVKEVTNSNTIPFKIGNSGPLNSLFLQNSTVGIGESSTSNTLDVSGDVEISSYLYIGDESTDLSWRISNINGTLTFELRENGIWQTAFEMD